jgi:hypothetical protein
MDAVQDHMRRQRLGRASPTSKGKDKGADHAEKSDATRTTSRDCREA